jgi:hypothetical protein
LNESDGLTASMGFERLDWGSGVHSGQLRVTSTKKSTAQFDLTAYFRKENNM